MTLYVSVRRSSHVELVELTPERLASVLHALERSSRRRGARPQAACSPQEHVEQAARILLELERPAQ
jgi:hypothetical protein